MYFKYLIEQGRYALLLFLAFAVLCKPGPSNAQTSAMILTDDTGKTILSQNQTRPMTPASTLKLLTSYVALKQLGKGYRFKTLTAYSPVTHDLFIKGQGDPLLISEELKRFAGQIKSFYALTTVRNIVIDASFFQADMVIPGTGNSTNPYDAGTGALCANFNTINFQWSDRQHQFVSAEDQTPFLDRFQDLARASGLKNGRIHLTADQRLTYPGELIVYFLREKGVRITGDVVTGKFCPRGLPAMALESQFTLEDIIAKLLTFSNNFIANQVMLTLGALKFGAPATLEKGCRILKQVAEKDLLISAITLKEGSGLSRENRISAEQMLRVLLAFKSHHNLMRQQDNEFYKTGTLSDVRTRAGYIVGQDKKLYPYVIMLNDTTHGYTKILNRLKQKVRAISTGHL